jgi:hypothetical protein
MFFNDVMLHLLEEKSNPVNRMYMHEINIKWNNFRKVVESEDVINNQLLVEKLNDFNKALTNKKYQFNYSTKNGFKKDSTIFSAKYLEDFLDILMRRQPILNNKGIVWKHQSFHTNIRYEPHTLMEILTEPMLKYSESPSFLMLAQDIEFRYRVACTAKTQKFHQYQLKLPLIVFHTVKNLTMQELLELGVYARMAKETFSKAKTIIVTETIEKGFIPNLADSKVDSIFILKKNIPTKEFCELQLDIINALEEKISDYIVERRTNEEMILKKGIIE